MKIEIFMIFFHNHIFLHINMSRNVFSICRNLRTMIFRFSKFFNFLHFLTMFTNIKAKNYHSKQFFLSTIGPILSKIFFEVFHKLFVFNFKWSNIFKLKAGGKPSTRFPPGSSYSMQLTNVTKKCSCTRKYVIY